jgi:hypothetical protein
MVLAMQRPFVCTLVVLLAGCASRRADAQDLSNPVIVTATPSALRTVEAFGIISDRAERSRALFLEASRVFLHPRCANCHPDGDSPYQGMEGRPHDPPVLRGASDDGVVGMRCGSCHQERNLELARVPGAPHWQLAPRHMAWVGKSPRAICEQMKDPQRNGNRTLAKIVEHNARDELVGWGWKPGHDREPAPGTQQQLGRLVAAWVETGAECPPEGARP